MALKWRYGTYIRRLNPTAHYTHPMLIFLFWNHLDCYHHRSEIHRTPILLLHRFQRYPFAQSYIRVLRDNDSHHRALRDHHNHGCSGPVDYYSPTIKMVNNANTDNVASSDTAFSGNSARLMVAVPYKRDT